MSMLPVPQQSPAPKQKPWKPPYKTVGLIVAFVVAILTAYQLGQNKETQDRAAGRTKTVFKAIRLEPQFKAPESKKRYKKYEQLGDADFVHFESVEDLCQFHPRILIQNTGDEVIENVHVEVEEVKVVPLVLGKPYVLIPPLTPLAEPSFPEDYVLSEKLNPGDCASLPIYRPLLRSLLYAQGVRKNGIVETASKGRVLHLYGEFELRCVAKAFAMSGNDRPSNEHSSERFPFTWNPNGFTEELCKPFLDRQPTVRIGKEQAILTPRVIARD